MFRSVKQSLKCAKDFNIHKYILSHGEIRCAPSALNIKNTIQEDKQSAGKFSFSPRSIICNITDYGIQRQPICDQIKVITPIIIPTTINTILDEQVDKDLILPGNSKEEKQAARLMVIRRRKMKKHQRRKLRKRMKYEWAKQKLRRRIRKEKVFQLELAAMVKTAEAFSAEEYVSKKISEANHVPLPRFWKGKRLPQFIIRQLMGIDKKIKYKQTDVYKA